ncbi:GNAT family N-acetyltransferase [Patescibacteria group bacterium]|nr:GNAT family N-acetyltransferase [Patescibacteria group bacterium]MBU3999829.1 GNAT family N-acetyltransferase [Patescibacteria group bacterium]MBU4057137.1 GNAT family N-acetyltransferase [Patescibacteria group bacterium]MBU4368172.1 GNAT family N-acetyltransferase [Patescibacteria group bacterium]
MNEIHSKKVILRKTTEKDLSDLINLWNDGRVMKWVGLPNGGGYDLEKARDWFNKLRKETNRHHFVVYNNDIGFCGEVYYETDEKYKRAGLDIKFQPEAQGRGLASDALNTLIEFIFKSESDIDAVWTEPAKENFAAQNLYTRCGLKPHLRPKDLKGAGSYWERKRSEK